MKSNVKTLIEDFFAITGRPISTLTVDEYMTFIAMSNKKNMSQCGNIPTMSDLISSDDEDIVESLPKENSEKITPVISTQIKDINSGVKKDKTEKINSPDSALAILQSVSG